MRICLNKAGRPRSVVVGIEGEALPPPAVAVTVEGVRRTFAMACAALQPGAEPDPDFAAWLVRWDGLLAALPSGTGPGILRALPARQLVEELAGLLDARAPSPAVLGARAEVGRLLEALR